MQLLNLIRHHEDVATYRRGRADMMRDVDDNATAEHEKQAVWHEEMAEYLRGKMEATE